MRSRAGSNESSPAYVNSLAISDQDLRAKLDLCTEVLDLATTPVIDLTLTQRKVGATVRKNLYLWLGSWLQEEQLPAPTDDWTRIDARLDDWVQQWHDWTSERVTADMPISL